jgi:hypothetical protein
MATVAVVPVTDKQVKNLAALDAWLETGPHYVRNALIGAAAGVVYGRVQKSKGGDVKGALAGAAVATVGGFLLAHVGKWASKKEHEILAQAHVPRPAAQTPVVTQGAFAGEPRALYSTGWFEVPPHIRECRRHCNELGNEEYARECRRRCDEHGIF